MTTYQRIKLPYKLDELEPIISFQTMHYHYEVLHKNYEIKLNEILRETEWAEKFLTLEELIENLEQLPEEIKDEVRFFGGGLINHNFFFAHLTKMSAKNEQKISPELLKMIEKEFVSLENLKKELLKSALQVRGSGWTWLVLGKNNKITIINTANQDNPRSLNLRPLLAIDVWEHAYFLDYGTNRKEYVEKILNNLLNWEYISQHFAVREFEKQSQL